jgi:hypothetical protein
MTPDQIHRWDLCVAVAWKLLGEDASWSQILFGGRHVFYDDSLPTE